MFTLMVVACGFHLDEVLRRDAAKPARRTDGMFRNRLLRKALKKPGAPTDDGVGTIRSVVYPQTARPTA